MKRQWKAIEELEGLLEMGCESVTFKADFVRRLLEERDAELLEMVEIAREPRVSRSSLHDWGIIEDCPSYTEPADCLAEFHKRRRENVRD